MHPDAGAFLVKALTERLEDVLRRGPLPPSAPVPAAPDPEESLRVVMVKLWPKLRAGSATPEQRAETFDRLRGLEVAARGDDLRFLDAMNNVYEALEGAAPGPDAGPFLQTYAAILEAHRERLDR